jgi:colanic acid biosynthesis glycosyl transferase WcaI
MSKFLIVSQVFWPDTASVAQHLFDIARFLSSKGNDIEIWTSRNNYESAEIKYPPFEKVENIKIKRLRNSSLGKDKKIFRMIDFLTFFILLVFRLIYLSSKKFDIVIGLTSPPLISFLVVFFTKMKGIKFCYWVMDLQPELAISSGYMKPDSMPAKILLNAGNYIFRNSSLIISLDNYMTGYIKQRGGSNVKTIPVWPVLEGEYNGERLDNPFRKANNFGNKIVIMYSGNHSVVHPLDTLLQTALLLKDDTDFLFVFVGGGVRKKDVTLFKEKYNLQNIVQLPYQERQNIHISLASADIQVVIMGENQVGFTHPNKIYGAMLSAKPVLYIGPDESHITDILNKINGNIIVRHSESEILKEKLLCFKNGYGARAKETGLLNRDYVREKFAPEVLQSKLYKEVELLIK